MKYPWLSLLFLVISLVIWAIFTLWLRPKKVYFITNLNLIKSVQKSSVRRWVVKGLRLFKAALVVSIMLACAILVGRPIRVEEKVETKSAVDIMLALDISGSMLDRDLQPNRLEVAKQAIKDFISGVKNERVGLIVFAGSGNVISPLTFDYSLISYFFDELKGSGLYRFTSVQGTAVGNATVLAVQRFDRESPTTRVVILLTDGESSTGIPVAKAAQYAKDHEVKVYSIYVSADGKLPKELQVLAQTTGGKNFVVTDKQALEQVFEEITSLEHIKVDAAITRVEVDDPNLTLTVLVITLILYLSISNLKFVNL